MTLLVPKEQPGPVFDLISSSSVSEKFPIRRLPTLAQKSLLSEKHIPLKPSTSFFLRKCYCSNSLNLYKRNKNYQKRNIFFEISSLKSRCANFIQFHELNKFTKIKHRVNKMPLFEGSLQANFQAASFPEFSVTDTRILHVQDAMIEHEKFHNRSLSFSLFLSPGCLTIKDRLNYLKISAVSKESYTLTYPRTIQSFFAQSIYAPHLNVASFSFIKHSLVFFSAHSKNFSLQFTSTALPATGPHSFVQTTNQTPATFQPMLEKTYAHFDFRNEIGKNLIIGTRAKIASLTPVRATVNSLPHKLLSSMKIESENGLIKHSWLDSHKPQFEAKESAFSQILVLRPSFMLPAPTKGQLQKSQHKQLTTFRAQELEKKIWLRLKLRLHSYILDSPRLLPSKPVIKRTVLPCILGSSALNKIHLCMPSRSGDRPLKFKQGTIILIPSHIAFCSKPGRIFLKTRSQALYTRKLMRKLIAVEAFKKSRKQYLEPGQLGYFTISTNLPTTLRVKSSALTRNISHIRIKPLNFYMQISAMDFTDIELPLDRRRLVPPKGVFPSSFALNIKLGSLMPLRLFLASSVTAQQQMSSNILKPIHRISPIFVHLKHFALPTQLLPLTPNYLVLERRSHKKANIATSSITENFLYRSSVPNSICDRLKLKFAILDDNYSTRRLKLDFCTPPDWEKSWRHFNCKLRLMPFAFGFPHFTYKQFLPKLMSSTYEPKPLSGTATNIKAKASYFLSNSKIYYHPLSQKEPKRWLHSFMLADTLKAENYKYLSADQFLEVSPCDTLKDFAYTWHIQKSSKLFYSARPPNTDKVWPEKIYFIEQQPTVSGYCQRSDKSLNSLECSGIRRFLLQTPSSSEVKMKDKSFILNGSFVRKLFNSDDLKHCKNLEPPFLSRHRSFSTICRDVLAFSQKLSFVEKLKHIKLTRFNAMFRVFRFPYVPEYSMVKPLLHEDWFSLEDASTVVNDSFSDDIRATQISCAFEIIQNSLDFILTSLPVQYRSKINHTGLEPEQVSGLIFNPEISLCSSIKMANNKRSPSIPAKYLFFPEQRTGNYNYLSQPAQRTVSSFPRQEPERLTLNYVLRSRKDQDFTKQYLGSVHWVIMLKNFMSTSQQALRYIKTGFNKAFVDQDVFAISFSAKPFTDYREMTCANLNLFSPQSPAFFAENLKHNSIASDPANLEFNMVPGSTDPPVFEYKTKVSQAAMPFAHYVLKIARSEKRYELSPAPIITTAIHAKKVDVRASFPVESGVRNDFANVFSSAHSSAERFRHPGYPEWIDMDIDVLQKKADSSKDMVKFLLDPLRH